MPIPHPHKCGCPLGTVSMEEHVAQQLTIILNNTKGEPDTIKLSELVAELDEAIGHESLVDIMPSLLMNWRI